MLRIFFGLACCKLFIMVDDNNVCTNVFVYDHCSLFCFDISLFKIFFFSSAGYLTQHMSYALDNFILIIGNIDTGALSNGYGSEPVKMMNIMSWVVYLDSYIAIYLIVYLVFCTRIQGNDFYISKMWTFVLCTIFMFSAIILNSFVVRTYDVKQNKIFIIISLLYSFSSSFISLLFISN